MDYVYEVFPFYSMHEKNLLYLTGCLIITNCNCVVLLYLYFLYSSILNHFKIRGKQYIHEVNEN